LDASVNHIAHLFATAPYTPNDPWWVGASNLTNRQWHMHRIDLPNAWKQSVGSGVVVAVIDTGVTNGNLDGFCHSFVDEVDIVFGITGPGAGVDWEGHGSHVAGSVAQCGGNGKWGTGVAPDSRIMPVNVFFGGAADAVDVYLGIHWAIGHGAKVINLSLGFETPSIPLIDEAIDEAVANGVVVIAAAGNEPGPVFYPARRGTGRWTSGSSCSRLRGTCPGGSSTPRGTRTSSPSVRSTSATPSPSIRPAGRVWTSWHPVGPPRCPSGRRCHSRALRPSP